MVRTPNVNLGPKKASARESVCGEVKSLIPEEEQGTEYQKNDDDRIPLTKKKGEFWFLLTTKQEMKNRPTKWTMFKSSLVIRRTSVEDVDKT